MYEFYKVINIFCFTIISGLILLIWLSGLISLMAVLMCFVIFVFVFIILPLMFRYSITIQRGILFLTFISYPSDLDLNKPSSVGLYATRSFFVMSKDSNELENTIVMDNCRHSKCQSGIRIGVWHVLPKHFAKRFSKQLQLDQKFYNDLENINYTNDDENLNRMEPIIKSTFPIVNSHNEEQFYEELLKIPGNAIIIYLHGNTASRGSGHRVDIYKLLQNLGYHSISIDYRSYGDSDPVPPTEEGVVNDALAVFNYVRNITSNSIIIWGHSLGTGVATNMLAKINHLGENGPKGLILESPFTNIRDEMRLHPFSKFFRYLPWFDFAFINPMYTNSLRFESDRHISKFHQPIMILHAEDDYVVPFQLGYKLYRIALDTRNKSWGPVEFHRFPAENQYGHKYICRSPELPNLLRNFIDNYSNEMY